MSVPKTEVTAHTAETAVPPRLTSSLSSTPSPTGSSSVPPEDHQKEKETELFRIMNTRFDQEVGSGYLMMMIFARTCLTLGIISSTIYKKYSERLHTIQAAADLTRDPVLADLKQMLEELRIITEQSEMRDILGQSVMTELAGYGILPPGPKKESIATKPIPQTHYHTEEEFQLQMEIALANSMAEQRSPRDEERKEKAESKEKAEFHTAIGETFSSMKDLRFSFPTVPSLPSDSPEATLAVQSMYKLIKLYAESNLLTQFEQQEFLSQLYPIESTIHLIPKIGCFKLKKLEEQLREIIDPRLAKRSTPQYASAVRVAPPLLEMPAEVISEIEEDVDLQRAMQLSLEASRGVVPASSSLGAGGPGEERKKAADVVGFAVPAKK